MKKNKILLLSTFIIALVMVTFISCKDSDIHESANLDEKKISLQEFETSENFSFDSYGEFHNEICEMLMDNKSEYVDVEIYSDKLAIQKSLVFEKLGIQLGSSNGNLVDARGEIRDASFDNAPNLNIEEINFLKSLSNEIQENDWFADDGVTQWINHIELKAERAIEMEMENLKKVLACLSIAKHSGILWFNQETNKPQREDNLHCLFVAGVEDVAYYAENCDPGDDPGGLCSGFTALHSLNEYDKCDN